MRPSALIGIGYTLFASGALANCYGGGAYFDTYKDMVKEKIDLFCQRPVFNTFIPARHAEKECYDLGPNKSVNIRFQNTNGVPREARPDDCKTYLRDEVNGCDRGGDSRRAQGYKVKVDPNDQKCPSP
ncbi:hypothetical protein ACKAV7_014603 [Fusarium commune]